jgi:hypothetical protein
MDQVVQFEEFTYEAVKKFEKFTLNREATLGKGSTASNEDRNKFIGNEMKRVLKRIFNSEDGKKVLISNNNINNYFLRPTAMCAESPL